MGNKEIPEIIYGKKDSPRNYLGQPGTFQLKKKKQKPTQSSRAKLTEELIQNREAFLQMLMKSQKRKH